MMKSVYAIEHHTIPGTELIEEFAGTRAQARILRNKYRQSLKGNGSVRERWMQLAWA